VEEANKQSGLQPVIESDEFPKNTMHFIICITVESGLLNTFSTIATFVTYVVETNAVYIMTAIVSFDCLCRHSSGALKIFLGASCGRVGLQPHHSSRKPTYEAAFEKQDEASP
jgi:hypothetical protein